MRQNDGIYYSILSGFLGLAEYTYKETKVCYFIVQGLKRQTAFDNVKALLLLYLEMCNMHQKPGLG